MGSDAAQMWNYLDQRDGRKYQNYLHNLFLKVWQIAHNVDIEGGKIFLPQRFPFLEFDTLPDMDQGAGKSYN